MRITNIAAKNFKGGSFTTPLAAITILCAPNGRGKTSRLDAVAVALSGWHPRLPRTNAGIMQLASGSPMRVEATLDDGRTVARQWTRKGEKVTSEASGSCETLTVPSVLLDPDSYFALSDRERVKYVFGLVPMPDAKDTFAQLVADLKNHKFEENTVETEKALAAVLDNVRHWMEGVGTTQEKLEAIVASLKASKAAADAAVKRMTGTVAGITELAAETLVDPSPEIAAAKQKLERLLGEQRDLQHALTRAAEVRQQRERLQAELQSLNNAPTLYMIQQVGNEILKVSSRIHNHSTVAAWESEAANLTTRKIESLNAGKQANDTYYQATTAVATRDRLEAELAAAQQEALGLAELEAELDAKQKRAAVLAQSSRIVPKDVKTLEQTLDLLRTADGDGCEELLDLNVDDKIQEMLANNATEDCNLMALGGAVSMKRHKQCDANLIKEQISKLPPRPDVAALEAALDARRGEYRVLDAKLKDAETKLKEARFADQQVAAARLTLAQKEAELARLQEAPKRIKELEVELVALVIPIIQGTNDPRSLQCEEEAQRKELATLDTAYRRYIAQRGEAATKQKAAQQRSLLEAEAAVAKVAIELVQAKQAAMVETAFETILAVANRVVDGVLPGELQYLDGEIGMNVTRDRDNAHGTSQGTWVSWRTMSGSEALVTLAAVAVSLAAQSPVKLVLLDEANRFDDEHSEALFENLGELVKDGTIDQVICAAVTCPEIGAARVHGDDFVSIVNL